jgi:ABC-type transport system involved in cytochrome c biogenesis ATPase subunit
MHSNAKKSDLSAFSHLKFWSQEIQAKNQRKNRTILHKIKRSEKALGGKPASKIQAN